MTPPAENAKTTQGGLQAKRSFAVSRQGISRALDFVASNSRTEGLTESVVSRLCVIVDEVCSNMIRHARLTEKDAFSLELCLGARQMTLIFQDTGPEFDPRTADPVARPKIGGHGIQILRGLASSISYERQEDRNVLTIILPSSPG